LGFSKRQVLQKLQNIRQVGENKMQGISIVESTENDPRVGQNGMISTSLKTINFIIIVRRLLARSPHHQHGRHIAWLVMRHHRFHGNVSSKK
jgi:hypothetical protein